MLVTSIISLSYNVFKSFHFQGRVGIMWQRVKHNHEELIIQLYTVFLLMTGPSLIVAPPPEKLLIHDNLTNRS